MLLISRNWINAIKGKLTYIHRAFIIRRFMVLFQAFACINWCLYSFFFLHDYIQFAMFYKEVARKYCPVHQWNTLKDFTTPTTHSWLNIFKLLTIFRWVWYMKWPLVSKVYKHFDSYIPFFWSYMHGFHGGCAMFALLESVLEWRLYTLDHKLHFTNLGMIWYLKS